MGNANIKQHMETATKTGAFQLQRSKLKEFPPELLRVAKNIRTLDLSDNRIGNIPSFIQEFAILKNLNMSLNHIDILPDELTTLAKLESLNLHGNRLTRLPLNVSGLTHLKQVDLSGNRLKEFPTALCSLSRLDSLDLSGNVITAIPATISSLNVIELNLNQNQIVSLPQELADCPRLKTLRLQENCLNLAAIPDRLLTDSQVSLIALEGNLFDSKALMELPGYEKYMERYTAVKKKMF